MHGKTVYNFEYENIMIIYINFKFIKKLAISNRLW